MRREDFRVGHFKVGDLGSTTCFVTLDGMEMSDVTECNDEEGWLVRNTGRMLSDGYELETECLEGEVEVIWR